MESKTKFWQYVEGVESGKVVANKWIKLAVKRFISDREKGEYAFDYKAGERIVKLAGYCHHWKGLYAGKPIDPLPHQHFYLIQLFGWKREDGLRRFRRSYKEIARKQAKTTECAVKGIHMLLKDGERGAQVFSAATKEDQAAIVVHDTANIIKISPHLKDRFKLYEKNGMFRRVICPETASFMRPLGRDSDTQDGTDPNYAIIDEYHAHPDNELVNVLQTGMGMRPQPMTDIITTAGFDMGSPCYNFRKTCMDVLEGRKEDDALLVLIFNLDNEDEWATNEDEWEKANPNMADPFLREKVILPYLRQQVKEALNEGGEKIVEVKTKNFNIWCDAPTVWISKEIWGMNQHGLI